MLQPVTRCVGFIGLLIAWTVLVVQGQALALSSSHIDPVCEKPDGLSTDDWTSIRDALEMERHAARPIERGFEATNPGQRWSTVFDGRGFTVVPDDEGWEWGLELVAYGLEGHQRTLGPPMDAQASGGRVEYRWNDELVEWYVNDTGGLEHGYTVLERPHPGDSIGLLTLTLAVRGGLEPDVSGDGRDVLFRDDAGATQLEYSGLTVYDADGRRLAARLERSPEGLRLSVDERGARYPLTIDPTAQRAYLKASNADGPDNFGRAVAVSGDTVVVGAPQEQSNTTGVNGNQADNSASEAGAAYVFVRTGSTWSQQAYLKASNTDAGDRFGQSVSISGDTLVVGASGEDSSSTDVNGNQVDNSSSSSGAAYVFVRSGSTWTQEAYLKASNSGANDNFGQSLSISGDTIVVGAEWEDSNATGINGNENDESAQGAGAAYVFVRSGTAWSQQAYLKASNTDASDRFGISVSVSGDTVVVGAHAQGIGVMGTGAAYVFVRSGMTWSQQAYLKASNPGPQDAFGFFVSVSGDTLAVGAPSEDGSATGVNGNQNAPPLDSAGAAYVFVRSGTAWSQEAYVKASNTNVSDQFGRSLALDGDRLLVAAPREDGGATGVNGNQSDNGEGLAGAVYSFSRTGSTWSQQAYVKASNTDGGDQFGEGVAVAGAFAVVGAHLEDSSAVGVNGDQDDNSLNSSGAAYVYDLDALGLDTTGNIYLTGHDVLRDFGQAGYDLAILDHLRRAGTPDEIPASDYALAVIGTQGSGSWSWSNSTQTNPTGYPPVTFIDADSQTSLGDWQDALAPFDVPFYQAIVVLSHESCAGCSLSSLGSANLNLAQPLIEYLFDQGMDVWANSGADLASYYEFLPSGLIASAPAVSGTQFCPTPAGDAIGLDCGMTAGYETHNQFLALSPKLTVMEQECSTACGSAPTGAVISVAATDINLGVAAFCAQVKPTSVVGCFPSLDTTDTSLATGTWTVSEVPFGPGTTSSIGLFLYTNGIGTGQSAVSTNTTFGNLCLSGFQRSAPACAVVSTTGFANTCTGSFQFSPDCNGGALGITPGQDVNVQCWYRDPPNAGQANLTNALHYTVTP